MNQLPPVFWQGPVKDEWTDYNGHLRDAFYLLLFSFAGDELMVHIGLGPVGREQTGHSLFTMECHLMYLREAKAGQQVEVRGQLLAHDRKRLHLYFTLHLSGDETLLASGEQLWLNVDMSGPKSVEFAPQVHSAVQQMAERHSTFPTPVSVGRSIRLPAAKAPA